MRRRSVLQGAAALAGGALLPEYGVELPGFLSPSKAAEIEAAVEAHLSQALARPLSSVLCGVVTRVDLVNKVVHIEIADGLLTGSIPVHDCSGFSAGQDVKIETTALDSAGFQVGPAQEVPFEELMGAPLPWAADGPRVDSYKKEPKS